MIGSHGTVHQLRDLSIVPYNYLSEPAQVMSEISESPTWGMMKTAAAIIALIPSLLVYVICRALLLGEDQPDPIIDAPVTIGIGQGDALAEEIHTHLREEGIAFYTEMKRDIASLRQKHIELLQRISQQDSQPLSDQRRTEIDDEKKRLKDHLIELKQLDARIPSDELCADLKQDVAEQIAAVEQQLCQPRSRALPNHEDADRQHSVFKQKVTKNLNRGIRTLDEQMDLSSAQLLSLGVEDPFIFEDFVSQNVSAPPTSLPPLPDMSTKCEEHVAASKQPVSLRESIPAQLRETDLQLLEKEEAQLFRCIQAIDACCLDMQRLLEGEGKDFVLFKDAIQDLQHLLQMDLRFAQQDPKHLSKSDLFNKVIGTQAYAAVIEEKYFPIYQRFKQCVKLHPERYPSHQRVLLSEFTDYVFLWCDGVKDFCAATHIDPNEKWKELDAKVRRLEYGMHGDLDKRRSDLNEEVNS